MKMKEPKKIFKKILILEKLVVWRQFFSCGFEFQKCLKKR